MARSACAKLVVLLVLVFSVTELFQSCQAQVNNVNPQFVFVHGIGHGAWCFTQLITTLQQTGYTATAIDLTSHGRNKAIADNVTTVAAYIQPLTDFFTTLSVPTILVGHSLGGGPISVIMENFPSKVLKAVYLAASMPTNGQTFFNAFPASTFTRLLTDGNLILNGNPPTSASLNVANLTGFFYNESPAFAVNLASTLVVPTPTQMGQEPITLTPGNYGSIRRFYVKTLADLGVTPEEQQQMIDANPPEKVYPLQNADHAVFFSRTIVLATILKDIKNI